MRNLFGLAMLAGLLTASAAHAQISDGVVKIGVLNDMSSLYADIGGKGVAGYNPAATSISGGKARAHSATRNSQRGSKAHPGGRLSRPGTVPSMVASGRERSVFRSGTACSRPRV